MGFERAIINGKIVTGEESYKGNIYIKDGKIALISTEIFEANEVYDASGKTIMSGFIDTHVHSRDGINGAHHKEDFSYSTKAAAAGGITTIFEMPNCNPAIYNVDMLESLVECVTPKAYVDFCVWGIALGEVNANELEAMAKAGVVGFKYFWGYAVDRENFQLVYNYKEGMQNISPPMNRGEIREMFQNIAKTGKILGIHAEDFEIIKHETPKVLATEGRTYADLLKTRPAICETTIIQSAIEYAHECGLALHLHHLAVGESVNIIRHAQAQGKKVTAETCPQYLELSAEEHGDSLGAYMKWFPLVREKYNQAPLWKGLNDGTIAHVSSDHAPHTEEEKKKGLFDSPSGNAGVETLGLLMINAVSTGKITENQLAKLQSENPAKLYGLYPQKGSLEIGTDADIVIIDFDSEYEFRQENMQSKVKLSPFNGRKLKGKPVETILRGLTVMRDGTIVGEARGKFLRV